MSMADFAQMKAMELRIAELERLVAQLLAAQAKKTLSVPNKAA